MTRTPLKLALIISVMLNLVLIGAFAGHLLSRPGSGPQIRTGDRPPISRQEAAERKMIGDILRQIREETASEREAFDQARRDLHETMTAARLDTDLAERKLTALRHAEESLRESMQTRLLERMPDLTQSQRTQLAGRLLTDERGGRRRFKRP